MRITRQQLLDDRMCLNQVQTFTELFGDSVNVTIKRCREHAGEFDWDWAARKWLRGSVLTEYEHQLASLLEKHKCQIAPLLVEYERQHVPLLEDFKRQRAELFARLYNSQGDRNENHETATDG